MCVYKIGMISLLLLFFSCTTGNVKRSSSHEEKSHDEENADSSDNHHHPNVLMTKIELDPKVSLFVPEFMDHKKIAGLLPSLSKENKSSQDMEPLLVASRLSGKNYDAIIGIAQKIADLEISKGINNEVKDEVKLEIALCALKERKYLQAEFFLEEILNSKNSLVRASALNVLGVISLIDGKEPEAVNYFNRSLKEKIDYLPAKMNLGFLSLKYGQLEKAKNLIENIDDSWFVNSGKIILSRHLDQADQASHLCSDVLKKKPNHKLSLFNCGLLEFQNLKQKKKAFSLISKALKINGGPTSWQQDGSELLQQLGKR